MIDREILIVAVDSPEEFDVVAKGHFYRYPARGSFPKHQAGYLALYQAKGAGTSGVQYVAKILSYKQVKRSRLAKEIRKYIQDYRQGDGASLVKISLGSLIRLHHNIINPKGRRVSYRYTTFDKLLTAETIDDL